MTQAYISNRQTEKFKGDSSMPASDEIRLYTVNTRDNYPGLGLHLSKTQSNTGIVVSKVEQGSPSSAVGMMVGDRIIEINDIYVEDMPFMKILQLLQGELKSDGVKFLVTTSPNIIGSNYNKSSVRSQQGSSSSKPVSCVSSGVSADAMTIGSLVSKGTGEPIEQVIRDVSRHSDMLKPHQLTDDKVISPKDLDAEYKDTLKSMKDQLEASWFKDDPDVERIMVTSKKRSYRSHPIILERNDSRGEWGMSVAPDSDVGHIISDVVAGSPADKGSIRRGHVIIQISDDVVLHLPYKKLVSRLQALNGRSVFLSVAPKDVIMRCAVEHIPILTQYDTTRSVQRKQHTDFQSLPSQTVKPPSDLDRTSYIADPRKQPVKQKSVTHEAPPAQVEMPSKKPVPEHYQTDKSPVVQRPAYQQPSPQIHHVSQSMPSEPAVAAKHYSYQDQAKLSSKTSDKLPTVSPTLKEPPVKDSGIMDRTSGQYSAGATAPLKLGFGDQPSITPESATPPSAELKGYSKSHGSYDVPIPQTTSESKGYESMQKEVTTPPDHDRVVQRVSSPGISPGKVRLLSIPKKKTSPVGFQLKTLEQDDGQSFIHAFGGIVQGMAADKAGVKEFDRLVKVDGVPVDGKTHMEVLEMLKKDVPQLNVEVTEDEGVKAALRGSKTASGYERESKEVITQRSDGNTHVFTMQVDPSSGSIGLRLTKDMVVQSVEPNGSADKAGLKRGDIVTNVNGENVSSSDHQNAFYHLRQSIGSGQVILTVKRLERPVSLRDDSSSKQLADRSSALGASSATQKSLSPIEPERKQSPTAVTAQQQPQSILSTPNVETSISKPATVIDERKPVAIPSDYALQTDRDGLTRTCVLTGLSQGSPLGLSLKDNKNRPAEITKITPGSPADVSGLHVRDYLLRINDTNVEKSKFSDIKSMITSSVPSGKLELMVVSDDQYDRYRGE